jgi:hypothetical protein
MAKRSRQGQKQCPECNAWIKGTRTKECPKCSHQFNGKKKAAPAPKAPASKPAPEPVQVEVEKPAKVADAITITQVKAVAELVALVGGFDRCHQLLAVVREVGGPKRMRDLLEALSAAQVGLNKV